MDFAFFTTGMKPRRNRLLLLMLTLCAGCSAETTDQEPDCNGSLCDSIYDEGKFDTVVQRVPWGQAIQIVGTEANVEAVLQDLDRMVETEVGAELVAGLEAEAASTDEQLVVRARHEPDGEMTQCGRTLFVAGSFDHKRARAAEWHIDDDGKVVVDQPGAALSPSRIRVIFNRACAPVYPDGAPCSEPYVWLFHELIHALHALRGVLLDQINDPSDPIKFGSNHEEAWTIGRGAYADEPVTENALRRAVGLPVRDSHASMCGPRY